MNKISLTPAQEAGLRSLGTIILFAILAWVSQAANLTPIIGASSAAVIALVANALDSAYSPNGTVLAGSIGSPAE